MRIKRLTSLWLAIMMALAFIPAGAQEEGELLVSAPLTRASDTLDGMVRVYLSSLGSVTALDLTVVGSYSVEGAYRLTLYDGQKVSIGFSTATGQITLTTGGASYPMGAEVVFRRHQTDGQSALKIAQANRPNNMYPGDLQLLSRTSGSAYKLYPIVHVYIEYYLYGVVPYEMSSSWPMEALKAQAVAARTYTLNRMNGRSSYTYDLVDTSSDQVYNGYVGTETNATRAVDATRGIVIMNNGKLSGTYYTASNGGQTEAVANAWGSTGYPYLGVKDDPFDLANPNTNKRKLVVYSNFNDASQNATLKSLMANKAQSVYGSSASIASITSVTPHTPKYAAPSRLYTKLDFGVTLTDGRTGTLTFDIFGELESPLSMSINSTKNELWYVERDGSSFIVRAARYGHGIGMSQRGAQQMSNMGYTYDQILGFYYEGCQRVQHTFTHTILPSIGTGGGTVVETEPPATIEPETGANARVSLVGVNDVLPVRFTPSEAGKILLTISNGAAVNVVNYGSAWTLIRYGQISGYVPTSALVTSGTPPTDSTASATNITQWALVTGTTSLNLRSGPSTSDAIIGSLPGGAALPILSANGGWVFVQYGQQTGYCSASYLTMYSSWPETITGSGDSAMVSLPGGIGSAPLYASASISGAVLQYVSHGTQVSVLSNDGSWCRVRVGSLTGYMLLSALDFGSTGVEPTDPPTSGDEIYAVVDSDASTLNLRSGPSTSHDVIAEIPRGTQIVVTSYGDEWCAVRWGSLNGYVMTKYLSFSLSPATPTPTPSATNVPSGSPALLANNADLYTSASTNSEIQLLIPVGETVTVLSWGETFSLVSYGNLTGYILTSTMQLYQDMETPAPSDEPTSSPTPTPTPTPTPAPTYTPVNAVGIVLVNAQLRQEPSTSSALLMSIPAATEVTVTMVGDSWCQVECAGTVGWMLTSQLHITEQEATPTPSEEPTQSPTQSPTPTPTSGDETLVTELEITHTGRMAWIVPSVTSVNLRAEASDTSAVLCEIPANAYLTAYETRPTWTQVVYEGETGYVYTRHVTYTEPVDALGIRYINTATDPLALRDAPSTSGKLLTRIDRGTAVTLIAEMGDWCKVQHGSLTGYCASRYLAKEKPPQQSADDTRLLDWTLQEVTGWTATVTHPENASVFAREWCSMDAPTVMELLPVTVVTIVEKGDIWSLVSIEGNEGYCLNNYLTMHAPTD